MKLNTSGNWSPAGVPAGDANTRLAFGATPNAAMANDIPGTLTVNGLTFNAGSPAYTLGGNGLDFRTGGAGPPQVVTNSANGVTIAAGVSEAGFYYSSRIAGQQTVTASASALSSATATVTVQ